MTKATQRRLCVSGLIAGIVLCVTFALVLIWQKEPSYQNKTLSRWMEDLAPPRFFPWGWPMFPAFRASPPLTARQNDAGNAIRAMGTNASPHLISVVRREDGKITTTTIAWINKQKFLGVKILSANQRRFQAYSALQELGYLGIPAWQEILLDEKLPLDPRQFAALSLANIRETQGPAASPGASPERTAFVKKCEDEAWRALSSGLGSANSLIRSNTAYCLGSFGPKAKGAIPALIQHAEDPDPAARAACLAALRKCEPDTALSLILAIKYEKGRSRAGAAASLGLLRQRPEESVQALMSAALDSEYYVRETAISALADFQSKASNAIPILLNACNDTNKFVRRAATNALAQIMPKAISAPATALRNAP